MYYVSRLSKPSMAFVNQIVSSGGQRHEAYSIAVAYVLARSLPLPPAEVNDLQAYYRLNLLEQVERKLDQLNCLTPFDWKEAKRQTEAFFRFRYRTAYPTLVPLAFNADRGVVDFFGISTHFNDGEIKTIMAHPEKISNLINNLNTLFSDLQEKKPDAATPDEESEGHQLLD